MPIQTLDGCPQSVATPRMEFARPLDIVAHIGVVVHCVILTAEVEVTIGHCFRLFQNEKLEGIDFLT